MLQSHFGWYTEAQLVLYQYSNSNQPPVVEPSQVVSCYTNCTIPALKMLHITYEHILVRPNCKNHTANSAVQTNPRMKNGVFWVVTPCGSCKKIQECKIWGFHFSGYEESRLLGCYAMSLVRTDVSEERIASNIRKTRIHKLGTTLAVTSNLSALIRNTM
jgi:hypothetical protein